MTLKIAYLEHLAFQNCIFSFWKLFFGRLESEFCKLICNFDDHQNCIFGTLGIPKLHIQLLEIVFWEPGRWVLQANMQFWWPSKLHIWHPWLTKNVYVVVIEIAYLGPWAPQKCICSNPQNSIFGTLSTPKMNMAYMGRLKIAHLGPYAPMLAQNAYLVTFKNAPGEFHQ